MTLPRRLTAFVGFETWPLPGPARIAWNIGWNSRTFSSQDSRIRSPTRSCKACGEQRLRMLRRLRSVHNPDDRDRDGFDVYEESELENSS
jgi:hypothetical protein